MSIVFVHGVYMTLFVLLSTITWMELYGPAHGRSVMKSIVTVCHGPSGISFSVRETRVGCMMFFVF